MLFLEAMQAVKSRPLQVIAWPSANSSMPTCGVVYANLCGGAQPDVGFRLYNCSGCSGGAAPRLDDTIFEDWTVEPLLAFQRRLHDCYQRREPEESVE